MATTISNGQSKTAITTGAATTVVKASPGQLGRIVVVSVGTTWTLKVYDDPATANNLVWDYATADGKLSLELGIPMTAGITVVTTGTAGRAYIVWS